MGRSRFVKPEKVRLLLIDAQRRAHHDLLKDPKVTVDAREVSAASLALAEANGAADYIDVKKQLTAGEQRRIFGRMVRDAHPGEKMNMNPEQVGLTRISEYLTGWGGPGFVDDNGPVQYSEDALLNLDVETFANILTAVEYHEEDQEKARTAAKNEDGASKSAAI